MIIRGQPNLIKHKLLKKLVLFSKIDQTYLLIEIHFRNHSGWKTL